MYLNVIYSRENQGSEGGEHDDAVDAVPGVAQVGVLVQYQPARYDFDHHLRSEEGLHARMHASQ